MLEAWQEKAEADARRDRGRIYALSAAVRTMIWSKSAPGYETMFPEDRKTEMSDDEMYAQVRALNALFGGKEA